MEARRILARMSASEKASQVLMTSIDGKDAFPRHLNRHFKGLVPGAVILFSHNVADSPEGLHSYIVSCERAFAQLGSDIPVIFAIDNEGGDVFRTGGVTSRLPSARSVAKRIDEARAQGLYRLTGRQLRRLGVTMNLAPVAETGIGSGDFLGSRAYSDDPETVSRYALSAVRGFREAGVIPVAKHFPGNSMTDPHRGISSLDVSRSELDRVRAAPFRPLVADGLPAVLVSHSLVPALDPDIPFCLSRACVTGYLRDTLGFRGLVLTDDISMRALTLAIDCSPGEAAVRAIQAGCDMIMTTDPDIRPIAEAIGAKAESDGEFASSLDKAVERILEMKIRYGIVPTALQRLADSRSGMAEYGVNASRAFDARAFSLDKDAAKAIVKEMQ